MNAVKFSVYPTVGQVVNVMHATNGEGKLQKAGREVRRVAQVHLIEGGYPTVKDHVGDVWSVKPAKLGEWDTVNPEQH